MIKGGRERRIALQWCVNGTKNLISLYHLPMIFEIHIEQKTLQWQGQPFCMRDQHTLSPVGSSCHFSQARYGATQSHLPRQRLFNKKVAKGRNMRVDQKFKKKKKSLLILKLSLKRLKSTPQVWNIQVHHASHLLNLETLQLPSEVPLVLHVQLTPSTAKFQHSLPMAGHGQRRSNCLWL